MSIDQTINLSNKSVQKFQQLYKEYFDEELTKEESYEEAHNLINLIKIICLEDS